MEGLSGLQITEQAALHAHTHTLLSPSTIPSCALLLVSAQVSDFGLACDLLDPNSRLRGGTDEYMAPELVLALKRQAAGEQVDVSRHEVPSSPCPLAFPS